MVGCVGNPPGGAYESTRAGRFERLLPPNHRTVLIRQALAVADALNAGLAGLLDNHRIGVVQPDRDGTLDAWLPANRRRLPRLLGRVLPDFPGGRPRRRFDDGSAPLGPVAAGQHVMPVSDAEAEFKECRIAGLPLLRPSSSHLSMRSSYLQY